MTTTMTAQYALQIGRSRSLIGCGDFAEASALYSIARDRSGEGCSMWPGGRIRNVSEPDCPVVARVSYNGKVWAADGALLFNPYANAADDE